MVINKLDIEGIAVFKPEYDPPVSTNRHRPETSPIAFEGVETIAGKVKGLRGACGIKNRKNLFNLLQKVWPDLTSVPLLV